MLIDSVNTYIRSRRSVGYKLEETAWLLRRFALFAKECGDTHVMAKTAITWAEKSKSQDQKYRRLKTVIRFARYMRAEDDRHEIPPDGVFCGTSTRRTPYVFSNEEIRLLVEQAGSLGPAGSIRPHTYSTLFALLSVTGLRISEALALQIEDFTRDGLIIRDTKFHKNRLVPVHDTTADALRRYLARRIQIECADDHFFVSILGKKISYGSTQETFQKVCAAAGIPRHPGGPKIRLHDMRHSFAVRALEVGPNSREGVTSHMLALSTYLGHASIASTYWYLESTPQLMSDIAKTCEAFVEGDAR